MNNLKIGLNLVGGQFWLAGVTILELLVKAMELLEERPLFYLVVTPQTLRHFSMHESLLPFMEGIVFWGPKSAEAKQLLNSDIFFAETKEELFSVVDLLFPLNTDVMPGYPAISWIPDFQHVHLPRLFTPEEIRWREQKFQAIAELAGYVYFYSAAVEQDFRKKFPVANIKSKTVFYRVLPDEEWFEGDPVAVRQKHGIPADFIICCNQFWAHKNHLTLYRALGILKQQGKVIDLVCTGATQDYRNAEYFQALHALAEELDIVGQLHITGPLPRQEQIQLLRSSRFLVQPSAFEGFSLTVAECRAIGKDVLLSDLQVHREHAYGELFDLTDDQELARKIGELFDRTQAGPDFPAEERALQESLVLARQFAHEMCDMFQDAAKVFAGLRSRKRFQRVTIATSLAPHGLENQQKAVESWLSQGFHVVSLNAADEVEMLRGAFPDVEFFAVSRDARQTYGKPYVYFDDFLAFFRERGDAICGIVNSDVHLISDYALPAFFAREAKDGLVFGSRIDVKSMDKLQGIMYDRGFDYFFFDRKVIDVFPPEEFCIGQPWWDYWLPIIPAGLGMTVKRLMTPVAYHLKHTVKWKSQVRTRLGLVMAKYITAPVTFDEKNIMDLIEFICSNISQRAQNIEIVATKRSSGSAAKIPVIFCHRGNSSYLQYSLMQAKKSNPEAEIILLGDETNNRYPFVRHVPTVLSPAARDFQEHYVHMSVNSPDYELFCFLRWFVMLSYCVRNEISRFHYIDSDVMLYADVNTDQFSSLTWGMLGKSMGEGFFATMILKDFCLYLIAQYKDAAVMQSLRELYETKRQAGEAFGICDMTFAERFAATQPEAYQDLTVIRNGAVFNDNIRGSNMKEFAIKGKNMGIILYQGMPYAYNEVRQQWVMLHSVHCQGPDLKPLMKILLEAPPCDNPEMAWILDEKWSWREVHLLELLGGIPQKLQVLQGEGSIDALEQKALLLGYRKLLDSLALGPVRTR